MCAMDQPRPVCHGERAKRHCSLLQEQLGREATARISAEATCSQQRSLLEGLQQEAAALRQAAVEHARCSHMLSQLALPVPNCCVPGTAADPAPTCCTAPLPAHPAVETGGSNVKPIRAAESSKMSPGSPGHRPEWQAWFNCASCLSRLRQLTIAAMRCREMADMRTAAENAERYLDQERGLRTTLGEALR